MKIKYKDKSFINTARPTSPTLQEMYDYNEENTLWFEEAPEIPYHNGKASIYSWRELREQDEKENNPKINKEKFFFKHNTK